MPAKKVTLVHKDEYILDFEYKDVSQVPKELSRMLGWGFDAFVPKKFETASDSIKSTGSRGKTLWKLFLNGKDTDVLVLFHVEKFSILAAWLYKLRNPRGFVYVKGDFNWHSIKNLEDLFDKHPRMVRKALKAFDIVSFENDEHRTILNKVLSTVPAIQVRNAPSNEVFEGKPEFTKKRPAFLAVGRLWYEEAKRYSLILKSVLETDFESDFEIRFIGETENEWRDFLKENSGMIEEIRSKKRVDLQFFWPIKDRRELMLHFQECSFFLISSISEGSPLVLPEAMRNGCIMASTDVWTVKQDYPDYALILSEGNPKHYGQAMKNALLWYEKTDSESKMELMRNLSQHCEKIFTWRAQLEPIAQKINQHYGN